MMKKFALFLICALSVTSFCAGADGSENGVSAGIRFFDKKIYFSESDAINILVTLTNNSPEVYRFRIADDRSFSVDFDTRTRSNTFVEQAPVLERRRATAARIIARDVRIEPGESFSFTENLRNWSNIDKPGSYVVQAKFYPELINSSPVTLVSNRLPLQIKPRAVIGEDGLPAALDIETGAVAAREVLSPDRIVEWTLRARQKSEWEKFFLYLDIEKMISRDGPRDRRWRSESEEGRMRMRARYREELRKSTIDGDVSAIPMSFEIERTSYNGKEGTVIVLEKFKTGDYIERKRYTYYFEKDDDYWMITDYTVMNLGTE